MSDLWAALSLVCVIEGLLLFVAPEFWKRAVVQLLGLPTTALRRVGAGVLIAGLVALYWVRGG